MFPNHIPEFPTKNLTKSFGQKYNLRKYYLPILQDPTFDIRVEVRPSP